MNTFDKIILFNYDVFVIVLKYYIIIDRFIHFFC